VALPAVVAHADWGSAPRKRQVAVAKLAAGAAQPGGYVVTLLTPAPDGSGPAGDLLHLLATAAAPSRAVVGFDFPIGLPTRRAGSWAAPTKCVYSVLWGLKTGSSVILLGMNVETV
jgi:hypothetical protein